MSFPLPPKPRRRLADFDVDPEVIGDGSLALVRVAQEKASGKRYALKAFDRRLLRSNHKEADVTIEEHCLRRANHPGIVKLHASFRDEEWHYFTLELCPGGELWSLSRAIGCPESLGRHCLCQVFEAVQYLRDARIVHRDLKAENVLIGPRGNCKLIDFGSARDLANPQVKGAGTRNFKTVMEEYVGTSNFMAPEVVKNLSSDFRSDTWSLGCLVFQVLAGLPPFHGGSIVRVYKKISKGVLEFPSKWLKDDAVDLIQSMVVKDPDARLGAKDLREVEEHPFFRGLGFKDAHRRPAPVCTLREMCLRQIGLRWHKFGEPALTWARSQPSLIPQVLASLERVAEVSDLLVLDPAGSRKTCSQVWKREGVGHEHRIPRPFMWGLYCNDNLLLIMLHRHF
ncbi:Pdpk1 [Symbiodinium microadriaticum]|nr:Pdpk1 [Symbiodinium sp. KB8]CAE7875111.1 Pdpk1 [Symbiodinium microadriaticum]